MDKQEIAKLIEALTRAIKVNISSITGYPINKLSEETISVCNEKIKELIKIL